VLDGTYAEDKIVVWHWAVLDRRQVIGFPREVGQSYELVVEPREGIHPELDGERATVETSEPLLDVYFDVTPPAGVGESLE
jgi:hypothetical protein